jgi:hypothetical protein
MVGCFRLLYVQDEFQRADHVYLGFLSQGHEKTVSHRTELLPGLESAVFHG